MSLSVSAEILKFQSFFVSYLQFYSWNISMEKNIWFQSIQIYQVVFMLWAFDEKG